MEDLWRRPVDRSKEDIDLPVLATQVRPSQTYDSPRRVKHSTRIALGWPTDGKILIKSLAENSANYPSPNSKSRTAWSEMPSSSGRGEHKAWRFRCQTFRRVSMHFRSESLRAEAELSRGKNMNLSLQERISTVRRIITAVALCLSGTLSFGQGADQHPDWPGKGQAVCWDLLPAGGSLTRTNP